MIWLLLPVISLLAEFEVTVVGKPEVIVERGRVTLDDIAEIVPEKNLDLALSLKKVVVLDRVIPGKEVFLTGSEIVNRMKEAGFNLAAIGYAFGESTKVIRKGQHLDREFIEQQLIDQHAANGYRVKVQDLKCDDNVLLPVQVASVKVDLQNQSGALSEAILGFEDPDGVRVEIRCSYRIRTLKPVSIFKVPVAKGDLISPEHVVEEYSSEKVGLSSAECVGRVAKHAITVGQVCSSVNTEKRVVARKKEPVEVIFKSGLLELRMVGILLTDAVVGEVVQVKNPSSGKIVSGVVREDGGVYVN